jgi:hypothetical protein
VLGSFFFAYWNQEYLKLRNAIVILKNGLEYKSRFVGLDVVAIAIIELVIIKEVAFSVVLKTVRKEHYEYNSKETKLKPISSRY